RLHRPTHGTPHPEVSARKRSHGPRTRATVANPQRQDDGRYFSGIVVEDATWPLEAQLHAWIGAPSQAPSAQTARNANMFFLPRCWASGPTACTRISPSYTASGLSFGGTLS